LDSVTLDAQAVKTIMRDVERKLEWKPSATWQHQDFLLLSERIFEETKINLSHTTLKRVWGKVNYKGAPSRSTVQALVKFIGYESYETYLS
jgi:hypothetical protein